MSTECAAPEPKWMTDEEHSKVRASAFLAVVISTVAVVCAIVTLPLLYNYIHRLQTQLTAEVGYCKIRSRDIAHEARIRTPEEFSSPKFSQDGRFRRATWLFGQAYGGNGGGAPSIRTDSGSERTVWQCTGGNGKCLPCAEGIDCATDIGQFHTKEECSTECKAGTANRPFFDRTLWQCLGGRCMSCTEHHNCAEDKVVYESNEECSGNCRPGPPGIPTGPIETFMSATGPVFGGFPQAGPGAKACGCTCHVGPPGSPGKPGEDAEDGEDGTTGRPGQDGNPGRAMPADDAVAPCMKCPAGPPGDRGSFGPKGGRGARGDNGMSGMPGRIGAAGPAGPNGADGTSGPRGPKGPKGLPGQVTISAFAPPGAPGPLGSQGVMGKGGLPGPDGHIGAFGPMGPVGRKGEGGGPGRSGRPGARGNKGDAGGKGACDQCPAPRTSPGY